MGARSNIALVYDDGNKIFFYGHWSGPEIADALKSALIECPGRWANDSYLARCIFSRMVPEEQRLDETGFGISPYLTDNGYPIIVVNLPAQTICLALEDGIDAVAADFLALRLKPGSRKVWTFGNFDVEECKAMMTEGRVK